MAMECPSSAEIASRLDRATRSVLASSSLTLPASPLPPLPSLADLVTRGDGNLPRCSNCKAELLRGAETVFCLACGAQQRGAEAAKKFSFKSSLAYQRFLDILQLRDLDNDSGNVTTTEVTPVQKLEAEAIVTEAVQSDSIGSSMDLVSKETNWQEAAREYSQQIKGISLEEFFLNQKQSQEAVQTSSPTTVGVEAGGVVDFGMNTSSMLAASEMSQDTIPQSATELDDLFFGSSWQQNAPSELFSDMTEDSRLVQNDMAGKESASLDLFSVLDTERKEIDLKQGLGQHEQVGILHKQHFEFKEPDAFVFQDANMSLEGTHSSNSKLEGIQIDQSDKDVPVSSHEAVESKSETVEALLAELHDLSFMLADKIVNTNVKTETLE
eukprot:c19990_g1_i2 orf=34-1182(+)